MKKYIQILLVVLAGEAIFMLPFLIPRLLRPLILENWSLTNQDIGLAFSAYGFTSIVSYFLGGQLADRYSPRKLVSASLFLTATAGLTLALFPSRQMFILIYGFFGVSTILLMWGALIKMAHLFAGKASRASAMGGLDGGRGLSAAIMSAALVALLASLTKSSNSLFVVYLTVSLFNFFMGILVWFGLKDFIPSSIESNTDWSWKKVAQLLKQNEIWLLSYIILCAYCGYKSVDNYSIYLVDVLDKSLSESSQLTSYLFWLRPVGAICAGLLVDDLASRFKLSRFSCLSVLLFGAGLTQIILGLNIIGDFDMIFLVIVHSALFVYALRAIYFAVFDELKIPPYLIGSAVGIVSIVGFLPDLFFGTLTGWLIDKYPGVLGFNYVYFFTGFMLLTGSIASFRLKKYSS